jgi:hypothetical protein
MYAYAGDMVMASTSIKLMCSVLSMTIPWAEGNSLQMKREKTEIMVFRKGGRESTTYCQERLRVVQFYKYLGITLQTTGKTFNLHIKEKKGRPQYALWQTFRA